MTNMKERMTGLFGDDNALTKKYALFGVAYGTVLTATRFDYTKLADQEVIGGLVDLTMTIGIGAPLSFMGAAGLGFMMDICGKDADTASKYFKIGAVVGAGVVGAGYSLQAPEFDTAKEAALGILSVGTMGAGLGYAKDLFGSGIAKPDNSAAAETIEDKV